jgi:hypothetical protein
MSTPTHGGPRPLGDILGELFTRENFGQLRTRHELQEAWNTAVGEQYCHQTSLGDIRRGVLNVTVAHSAILEELLAFHKPALLSALQSSASGAIIRDIRFHVSEIPRVKNQQDVTLNQTRVRGGSKTHVNLNEPQSGRDNKQG